MKEIFVMNKAMHMGPINRNVRTGDVIVWEPEICLMTMNGSQLPNDGRSKTSTEGFAELSRILKMQAKEQPTNPWAQLRIEGELGEDAGIKTDTLSIFPVLGCLRACEEWMGSEQTWTPVNERQTEFLEHFIEGMDVADMLGSSLVRKASDQISVINDFLSANGFPELKLTVEPGPAGFCVASVLDVLCEWLKEGSKTTISNGKGEFSGVKLKKGVCAYMDTDVHPYPVVKIRTKSGDVLCMSICGTLSSDPYAVHWKAETLRAIQKPYSCEGVIFPMVNYERMIDISYLEGMRTGPDESYWYVAEAIQKTRFRMNEFGARAQSAAAMTMWACAVAGKPWVVIDKPFVLWIEREGVSLPLFGGVFAEDVWENPGSLE